MYGRMQEKDNLEIICANIRKMIARCLWIESLMCESNKIQSNPVMKYHAGEWYQNLRDYRRARFAVRDAGKWLRVGVTSVSRIFLRGQVAQVRERLHSRTCFCHGCASSAMLLNGAKRNAHTWSPALSAGVRAKYKIISLPLLLFRLLSGSSASFRSVVQ